MPDYIDGIQQTYLLTVKHFCAGVNVYVLLPNFSGSSVKIIPIYEEYSDYKVKSVSNTRINVDQKYAGGNVYVTLTSI